MVKKALAGAVAVASIAGCLALFGCSSGANEQLAGEGSSEAPTAATQQEPEQKSAKYTVNIDDCTVTTDYSGALAVVITYTFTNDSDKATPFFTAISAKAFQNGVQLDTGIVEGIDAQSTMNEIKSGATTTVQQAYVLDDQSDVNIECTELISFDDTIIAEKTFSVA